ncbi:hypothetical protein JMJ77_0011455, partial [Colletotrichum scovillei]
MFRRCEGRSRETAGEIETRKREKSSGKSRKIDVGNAARSVDSRRGRELDIGKSQGERNWFELDRGRANGVGDASFSFGPRSRRRVGGGTKSQGKG